MTIRWSVRQASARVERIEAVVEQSGGCAHRVPSNCRAGLLNRCACDARLVAPGRRSGGVRSPAPSRPRCVLTTCRAPRPWAAHRRLDVACVGRRLAFASVQAGAHGQAVRSDRGAARSGLWSGKTFPLAEPGQVHRDLADGRAADASMIIVSGPWAATSNLRCGDGSVRAT